MAQPVSRASWFLVACVLTVGAMPPTAHAQSDFPSALETAVQLYKELEYEQALEQLQRARRLARNIGQEVTVSLHEGIILGDMGQRDQARAAFKKGLFLNPEAKLPLKVSPKLENDFEAARVEVREELRGPSSTAPPVVGKIDPPSKPVASPSGQQPPPAEARPSRTTSPEEEIRPTPPSAPVAAGPAQPKPSPETQADPMTPSDVVGTDQARQVDLSAPDSTTPEPFEPSAEAVASKRVPVAPLVLAGAGVAVAGVGAVFGLQSRASIRDARSASFQDETRAHLNDAQGSARMANVLFGTAGLAVTGAVVTWLLSSGDNSTDAPREIR
jgi:hypothetical protein